jgi:hypothetical protein
VPGDGGDRLAAGLPGAGDGQDVVIDSGAAAATPALGPGAMLAAGCWLLRLAGSGAAPGSSTRG